MTACGRNSKNKAAFESVREGVKTVWRRCAVIIGETEDTFVYTIVTASDT